MTVPTPPTHQDGFAESTDAERVPESFQRDFWVPFLRDLRGFDPAVLAERSDAWVWARAREVTA